ncbi:protein KRTCAP2 homolog [Neocloeon triangulifer]|uniref:protein KRTCAP2 homolog n=1 Tax=Neocloeon triangulifer TaxID=2078957 RepID=UPI00286F585D|nr:protein KRTCAP2 homolog [Neocloeon triangulifer]
MAVSSGTSFALASIFSILLFSGMQMYKQWLAASQVQTIFGGYLGSVLFILSLTAIGNLEALMFGKDFQTKLPEVIICLVGSVFAAGMIHRVCTTTCLIFSLISLYFVNNISQKTYTVTSAVQPQLFKKKK